MKHKKPWNKALSLVLSLTMVVSLLPAAVLTAAADGATHIATYVGEVPKGVEWADSVKAENFDTAFTTVKNVPASDGTMYTVEVVPKGLYYFVDAGTTAFQSEPFAAISTLVEDLKNDVSDQAYGDGKTWGYEGTATDTKERNVDGTDMYPSLRYASASSIPVSYVFAMDPGIYSVTLGFYEPDSWIPQGTTTRTANITVSVDGAQKVNDSYTFSKTKGYYDTKTLSAIKITSEETMKIVLSTTGSQAVQVSWIAVVKEDENKAVSAQDVFVATYVGAEPALPGTVTGLNILGEEIDEGLSVEWESANYDTPYATVTVNGTATQGDASFPVKAYVQVVPANLVYFVDAGTNTTIQVSGTDTTIQSKPFPAIKTLIPELKNDVSDQAYDENTNTWGYEGTHTTARNADGTDMYESFRYPPSGASDRTVSYIFDVEPGIYSVDLGFYDPWASSSITRKVDIAVSVDEGQVKTGSYSFPQNKKEFETTTISDIEVTAAGKMKVVLTRNGSNDVQVSWIAITSSAIPTEYHIATYVGVVPDAPAGVTWNADVTADKFSDAYATVTVTGTADADPSVTVTATVEVVPEGLTYFVDCGTGPDWTTVMADSNNSEDKDKNRNLASGSYNAVAALVGEGLANKVSDQRHDAGDSWGFLHEKSDSGRSKVLQTFPNGNSTVGFTDNMVVEDKYKVGLRASTTENFTYYLTLEAGTYELTSGYREFYTSSAHTRLITPSIVMADTEDVIQIGQTVTMKHSSGTPTDLMSTDIFTLTDNAVIKIKFFNTDTTPDGKGSEENGSMNWFAVARVSNNTTVAPNTTIPGTDGGFLGDTDGNHVQSHGGQVQWLEDLGLWIWYGEDKTGSGVRGVRCYTSPDLYNWTDHGTVLYVHDVMPAKATSDTTAELDTDQLAKLKSWAGMSSPDGTVTQDQINGAKAFMAAYKNGGGYDEEALKVAFWNLFSGYCIVERPKMLYNEVNKQYVLIFHSDGPTDKGVSNYASKGNLNYVDSNGKDATYSRYSRASMGFAVSDSPYGPFKLVNVTRMNYVTGYYSSSYGMARDMNVFIDVGKDVDKNGVDDAYAIYSSEENEYLYVSLLNKDYTGPATEGNVNTMTVDGTTITTFAARVLGTGTNDKHREAPAIFTYGGYYYLITSGTSGWDPNPARYHRATNIMGPYSDMGDPFVNDTAGTTFGSQPTCVIPYDAENGKFIYMGDRWYKYGLTNSSYVWLPFEVQDDGTIRIESTTDWTLDVLDTVKIVTKLPTSVLLGDELVLPDELELTFHGESIRTGVTWNTSDLAALKEQIGVYPVTGTLANGGAAGSTVTIKIMVVPRDVIYFVDSGASAPTAFFEATVEGSKDTMVNMTAADQAWTEGSWGYKGTNTTARSAIDVNPFVTLRYVTTSDRNISYLFPLEAGTYDVAVGFFDPWYKSTNNRVANVSLTLDGAVVGDTKSHTITDAYDTVTFDNVTVTDPADLNLLIAPKNSGSDTDVQVSWIAVTKRVKLTQEAPTGLSSVKCTTSANNDGKITGVTTSMEYKLSSEATWTTCTGTEITDLAPGTYQVRLAETETHQASPAVTIEVLAYGALDKAETPTGVAFDAADMTLSGVNDTMEYSLDGGTTWTQVAAGATSVALSDAGLAAGSTIEVRVKAVAGVNSASDPVTITLTQAAAPTGLTGVAPSGASAKDGKITGLDNGKSYEYKSGDGEWAALTEETGLETGSYFVRVAGSGTVLPSESVTVTVPAYTAPDVPGVTGVILNKTSATIYVSGSPKTVQLTATLNPEDAAAEITWTSSDNTIATVSENGLVTAVAAGTATITATAGGVTAECVVTVNASSSSGGTSGGTSGGSVSTKTETTTNDDGSVTTKVTDSTTGTVTETTEYADGTVSETVTEADGTVSETVTEPSGKQIATVTEPGEGRTITVKDPKGETVAQVVLPEEIPAPTQQFIDVGEDHWAKEAVDTVTGLGLFKGTSEGVFSDKEAMTRGMIVTVLHRLSGEVAVGENLFSDVANEEWYAAAVSWASANEIVEGVGEGTYAPEQDISRQQLVTMLYRYAKFLGLNITADKAGMNAYPDVAEVDDWAADAMAWAVESGLVNGRGGSLVPGGSATRAEVATILDRFVKLLSK